MLQHVVLFQWKPGTPDAESGGILKAVQELSRKLPGIRGYGGGPDLSNRNLNHGFTHGFVAAFEDAASLKFYLEHPDHLKVVERIKKHAERILVFDTE